MLSGAQRKMMELKNHKYGSVGDEDENEPKSSQQRVFSSVLACGMALLVVGGAIGLAVFFLRAQHSKPAPIIPTNVGSHQLDVASDCDPAVEGFVAPNMCVSCFHMSTPPKVQPENCPAGTYYDEENTCSCVPCLKHNCCPGRDKMEECPTGSFQPKTGQKTCELAIVFGDTIEYKYDEKSLLNQMAKPAAVSQPKIYDTNKCNGVGDLSDGIAFISGITSGDFDIAPKLSLEVTAQSAGIKESKVLASKPAGSRISGYAAGVVYTCLRQNFVTTLGYVSATKITAANPKTRILQPNLQCKDSSPQIFAALSGIESVQNSAKRLSVSLKASVRSNENDMVRPKVQFLTTTAVAKATAAVFAYCSSPTSVLSEGIIESGVFSGGASSGVSNKVVTVNFRTPKKCIPTIALGLTNLNVISEGGLALNLELLGETVTTTSFQVKIAAMTPTMKVQSIEGAYLATCGMLHSTQTEAAMKKVCSVPTN